MPAATLVRDQETASSQKPIKTIRLRGISASVFANPVKVDGRVMTFHKVSVQRAYKNGDAWRHTTSFGRDDLPIVATVLQRAWEFILDAEAARNKDETEE